MPDRQQLHQAALRHAQHYQDVLEEAHRLYEQSGPHAAEGLGKFDAEQLNIVAGQKWTAAHVNEDAKAALLCSIYFATGVNILMLRLHPRERVEWLKAEVAATTRGPSRVARRRTR